MRVAIMGSKGLLGSYLSKTLKENGIDVVESDIPGTNIISYTSVKKFFRWNQPIDFLINCAAFTDVPLANIEKKKAYFLNSLASGILARACVNYKTHLIHFSTDFVFDGLKNTPYVEDDPTNPLNYYGESKLKGENIIKNNTTDYTIFRLQWLFGNSQKTFFSKILERSKTTKELKIITDEIGAPCSVRFISKVIHTFLLNFEKSKNSNQTYHLTHNNYCSRFDCAKYFLDKIKWDGVLIPALKSDFTESVDRPSFGVMSNKKLSDDLKIDLGTWESDIDDFISEDFDPC